MSTPSLELYYGQEGDDIELWLHTFEKLAQLSNWSDREALDFAEFYMRGKAKTFFVGLQVQRIHTVAAVKQKLIARFGDSPSTLLTRLMNRKQPTESVRDYVDAMQMLLSKT